MELNCLRGHKRFLILDYHDYLYDYLQSKVLKVVVHSSFHVKAPSDFQENPFVACKTTFLKFESLIQNFANDFFFLFVYRMASRIERRITTLVS